MVWPVMTAIVASNRHPPTESDWRYPIDGSSHAVVRPLRDKQVGGTSAGLAVDAAARKAPDIYVALPIDGYPAQLVIGGTAPLTCP